MTLMARGWGRKSESATDRPTRPDTEPVEAVFKIDLFDAKVRLWPQNPSSKLHFSMQKWDSGLNSLLQNWHSSMQNAILASNAFVKIAFFEAKSNILTSKDFFKIAFFDANMWFWSRMPISKLHFSTQKWDNCTFRRKHEILVSNAFFKIAFFDANMRFWRRMLSSNLQFSMQIICQICDYVANLKNVFCDKVFQNLSSHALRASHGGGSPWVEQTRHAVFLYIHAV